MGNSLAYLLVAKACSQTPEGAAYNVKRGIVDVQYVVVEYAVTNLSLNEALLLAWID